MENHEDIHSAPFGLDLNETTLIEVLSLEGRRCNSSHVNPDLWHEWETIFDGFRSVFFIKSHHILLLLFHQKLVVTNPYGPSDLPCITTLFWLSNLLSCMLVLIHNIVNRWIIRNDNNTCSKIHMHLQIQSQIWRLWKANGKFPRLVY